MYSKIICPTDFSAAARNATSYAAKLSQVFWSELLLVNVQKLMPVAFAVSMDISPEANLDEKSRNAAEALEKISDEVSRSFKITCKYEVEITGKTIAKAITDTGDKGVLFVMGTNGADNFYQTVFGSNSFRVVRQTESPVLIVPENYEYKTIENVLFVVTRPDRGRLPLTKLQDFIGKFNAQVTFLVTGGLTAYEECRKEASEFFGDKINLNVWNKETSDVTGMLDELAGRGQFDLIVMEEHDAGFIERIFRTDPVKQVTAGIETPLLVLHAPGTEKTSN